MYIHKKLFKRVLFYDHILSTNRVLNILKNKHCTNRVLNISKNKHCTNRVLNISKNKHWYSPVTNSIPV